MIHALMLAFVDEALIELRYIDAIETKVRQNSQNETR